MLTSYAKAFVGGCISGLTTLGIALNGNSNLHPKNYVEGAIAFLTVFSTVFLVPNQPQK